MLDENRESPPFTTHHPLEQDKEPSSRRANISLMERFSAGFFALVKLGLLTRHTSSIWKEHRGSEQAASWRRPSAEAIVQNHPSLSFSMARNVRDHCCTIINHDNEQRCREDKFVTLLRNSVPSSLRRLALRRNSANRIRLASLRPNSPGTEVSNRDRSYKSSNVIIFQFVPRNKRYIVFTRGNAPRLHSRAIFITKILNVSSFSKYLTRSQTIFLIYIYMCCSTPLRKYIYRFLH